MKNKTKIESDSLLRIPKAKNKLGLRVHKIAMPHDDLIRSEDFSSSESAENLGLPSQSSQTTNTSQSSQTSQARFIAPVKDFQKTPNSITRQAIPDGLFKGKSKQLYDALYSLSRGSINPSLYVRIRKSKLMTLANIGSRATFDSNINHLQAIGLIKETVLPGEHEGNKFEVFLPEEIKRLPSQSSQSSLSSLTETAQKQDSLLSLETSQSRQSLKLANENTYEFPKTSLKTNTKNDDDARVNEAFSMLTKRLDGAVKKLTGKGVSRHEAEKWGTLAELLILEMEQAARRTDSISSVPAFLTEVLRRKLFSGNYTVAPKTSKSKPDTVGAPNKSGDYEIKPLDESGREAAVEQLREFAGDDFLPEFKKWYTTKDWEWIVKQLGIN